MKELTDLELCKKIAEIEQVEVRELSNNFLLNISCTFGTRANISCEFAQCKTVEDYKVVEAKRKEYLYNPLTNDALCFKLVVKHRLEIFQADKEWHCTWRYSNLSMHSESLNKAICLAIIRKHKQ